MKNDPNNDIFKLEFRNYVKVLNKVIKDAKIKHENKVINASCNKTRQLWKIIISKIGKEDSKNNNTINQINTDNNEIIKESSEIANYMNDYTATQKKKNFLT